MNTAKVTTDAQPIALATSATSSDAQAIADHRQRLERAAFGSREPCIARAGCANNRHPCGKPGRVIPRRLVLATKTVFMRGCSHLVLPRSAGSSVPTPRKGFDAFVPVNATPDCTTAMRLGSALTGRRDGWPPSWWGTLRCLQDQFRFFLCQSGRAFPLVAQPAVQARQRTLRSTVRCPPLQPRPSPAD